MRISAYFSYKIFKYDSRYLVFCLAIAFFYNSFFTLTDFYDNPFNNFKDFGLIFFQWILIGAATFGMIGLLAFNKYIFAISFPAITVLSSILAYFRITVNTTLTPMIMDAALDNDIRTSLELISSTLIFFILTCLGISLYAVYYRFKRFHYKISSFYLLLAICLLILTNGLFHNLRRPISERIPFNIFYTLNKHISEKHTIAAKRTDITSGAVCNEDTVTVVLILGESLRSDHLGINGYHRNTTPYLEKANVVSLGDVYSEYTYTNRSLPHILTRADSANTELAFEEESFISIFNKCGYHTNWIANQESALTYAYFINEAQNVQYANMGKSVYNYDKWLDEDLLPYMDKSLETENPKKLIVLHSIGSHWWYNAHFPESFMKYMPIVKSKIVSSCTNEEMINSYDNTILYSDYFFNEVIDRLKPKNAILIYISDHGEALGEDGQWLHANDNHGVHKTASFIWMSETYKERYPEKSKALEYNSKYKWRTDYLFHTILDAGAINSPYKVEELNILSTSN